MGSLDVRDNNIADLGPLSGLSNLSYLDVRANPLDEEAVLVEIPALQARGVYVERDLVEVEMPDDNLRAALKEQLGRNVGDPIYDADLVNQDWLGELRFVNREISNLAGLEWITSLWFLDVRANPLDEEALNVQIPALQARGVDVRYGDPVEVTIPDDNLRVALEKHLQVVNEGDAIYDTDLMYSDYLDLSGSDIIDISPLAEFTVLIYLNLSVNPITNLAGLEWIPSLRLLDVRANPLDEEALNVQIPALQARGVDVRYGDPVEVTIPDDNLRAALKEQLGKNAEDPIYNTDWINNLWLVNRGISNLAGLESLIPLRVLYLQDNDIVDLGPLSGLAHLEVLNVRGNPLDEEAVRVVIPALQARGVEVERDSVEVEIPDDNLRAALAELLDKNAEDPIHNENSINNLWLVNRGISNLAGLELFYSLNELYLSNNDIADLGPLSRLSNLSYLNVRANPLDEEAVRVVIPALQARGVEVERDSVEVEIPDDNLRAALKEQLGKNEGDSINDTDLAHLGHLDLSGNNIVDVGSLSWFTNLTYLDLSDNNSVDVGSLSRLTNLTYLDLSGSNIVDVGPLLGLTNLTYLDLSDNNVVDFGPLSGLAHLEYLNVRDNPLDEEALSVQILPLQDAGVEVILDLVEVEIPDDNLRAALAEQLDKNEGDPIYERDLADLDHLDLSDNNIMDIGPLSGLTALNHLDLSGNGLITDIRPLRDLISLQTLRLNGNNIHDIGVLRDKSDLEHLDLGDNQITDVQALVDNSGLGTGDVLFLTGNPLGEQAVTAQIPELQSRGFADFQFGDFITEVVDISSDLLVSQDIGSVSVAGSTEVTEQGKYLVTGGGAGIWGTNDAFRFAHMSVSGDSFQAIVKVLSIQDVHEWTKAGIMIRQSRADDSPYAFMFSVPGNSNYFEWRMGAGEEAEAGASEEEYPPFPHYLKLIRNGDIFSGYASKDGNHWRLLDTVIIDMPETVFVGLAVTSRSPGKLATAIFADFGVSSSPEFTQFEIDMYKAIPPSIAVRGDILQPDSDSEPRFRRENVIKVDVFEGDGEPQQVRVPALVLDLTPLPESSPTGGGRLNSLTVHLKEEDWEDWDGIGGEEHNWAVDPQHVSLSLFQESGDDEGLDVGDIELSTDVTAHRLDGSVMDAESGAGAVIDALGGNAHGRVGIYSVEAAGDGIHLRELGDDGHHTGVEGGRGEIQPAGSGVGTRIDIPLQSMGKGAGSAGEVIANYQGNAGGRSGQYDVSVADGRITLVDNGNNPASGQSDVITGSDSFSVEIDLNDGNNPVGQVRISGDLTGSDAATFLAAIDGTILSIDLQGDVTVKVELADEADLDSFLAGLDGQELTLFFDEDSRDTGFVFDFWAGGNPGLDVTGSGQPVRLYVEANINVDTSGSESPSGATPGDIIRLELGLDDIDADVGVQPALTEGSSPREHDWDRDVISVEIDLHELHPIEVDPRSINVVAEPGATGVSGTLTIENISNSSRAITIAEAQHAPGAVSFQEIISDSSVAPGPNSQSTDVASVQAGVTSTDLILQAKFAGPTSVSSLLQASDDQFSVGKIWLATDDSDNAYIDISELGMGPRDFSADFLVDIVSQGAGPNLMAEITDLNGFDEVGSVFAELIETSSMDGSSSAGAVIDALGGNAYGRAGNYVIDTSGNHIHLMEQDDDGHHTGVEGGRGEIQLAGSGVGTRIEIPLQSMGKGAGSAGEVIANYQGNAGGRSGQYDVSVADGRITLVDNGNNPASGQSDVITGSDSFSVEIDLNDGNNPVGQVRISGDLTGSDAATFLAAIDGKTLSIDPEGDVTIEVELADGADLDSFLADLNGGQLDILHTGTDTLQVSIPLDLIHTDREEDNTVKIVTRFGRDWAPDENDPSPASLEIPAGRTPDFVVGDVPWLVLSNNSISLAPGVSVDVGVTVDVPDAADIYKARIVLALTEDDGRPMAIPVTLQAGRNSQLAVLEIEPREALIRVGQPFQFEVTGTDVDGIEVPIDLGTVAWSVGQRVSWPVTEFSVGGATSVWVYGDGSGRPEQLAVGDSIVIDGTGTAYDGIVSTVIGLPGNDPDIFELETGVSSSDIDSLTGHWSFESSDTINSAGEFISDTPGKVRIFAAVNSIIGRSGRIKIIGKILGDSTGPELAEAFPDGQPDGQVDIFDLVNMAYHWGATATDDKASNGGSISDAEFDALDVAGPGDFENGDGHINIFDLIVLADNYGKGIDVSEPSAAPSLLASLPIYEGAVSELLAVPSGSTTQDAGRIRTLVDSELDLDVWLRDVSGMRAFSFDLAYDSNIFEVLSDSDERPVFEEGTMLESETLSAYTVSRYLSAANTPGMVNIASALMGKESSPDSSGTLGRLKLKANAVGESQVTLRNLVLVDNEGRAFIVPDVQYEIVSHQKVEDTRLLQNYPNPFNPETWIPFELKKEGYVTIAIYDMNGQMVRKFEVGHRVAGPHTSSHDAVYWDGRNNSGEQVASGVYFYHLRTNDYGSVKKMVILK